MTAAPTLRLSIGQHSSPGRQPHNQDFHGAVIPAPAVLQRKGAAIALADGIGSSRVSHIASASAVHGFLEDYYATSDAWTVRRSAQRVLSATNAWLHAQTQRGDGRFDKDQGYVCTFSALVFKGREAHLLHVGDSRICRVHAHALEPLTEDHRVRMPGGEVLLGRALGTGPHLEIDYAHWPAQEGELYILATDGAHEYLDAAAVNEAIAQHAASPEGLDAAARALVALAEARGSDDNLTVQLVRVDGLPEPEASDLPQQRQGLQLPPALKPRMDFEGYRIVRELHASARSHVHLATDTASGAQVVLKTPSVDLREDAHYLDSFVLEEWVARRVDSPHVIKAVDSGRPRQHLYVALEYVEGQTLQQWMTDHPSPSLDAVRDLVEQIARGLQAFHRKEMLHQDLRPANVMIDRGGTARLIDFGAVHVAGLAELSGAQATALRGELQYTAPEYFAGQGGSMASDLFSLAVITYQLLCGRLPYGLQVPQVRQPADLHKLRYVPLRTTRPDLPAWLDAVLRKALHPQPARRQEALSEFVHDLRHPGAQFRQVRALPLTERHPLLFWRLATLVSGLAALVLLGLRLAGR